MEEALGADGYGFLEQHDALIGLVADELQGGEAAGRRHVEMLSGARWHDKAFCCSHVGVLPCGGMRINVGTMNINVHELRSSRLDLPAHDSTRSYAPGPPGRPIPVGRSPRPPRTGGSCASPGDRWGRRAPTLPVSS